MSVPRLPPIVRCMEGKIGIYVIYSMSGNGRRRPLYVGQSANPQERFRTHLSASCHNADLDFSIQLCVVCGGGIAFQVVEWCDPSEADARERFWIAEQSKDRDLCNVAMLPPKQLALVGAE